MAVNSFVNTRKVAFKALDEFMNTLEVVDGFDTSYAKEFGQQMQIGDNLLIRKPYRWEVTNGANRVSQPLNDQFYTLTIDRHKHIGFDYSQWDLALNVNDIYDRCFETTIPQLANSVDDDAARTAYINTNNIVGKLGTDPASLAESQQQMLYTMAKLKNLGCSNIKKIKAILGPMQSATLQSFLNQQFNNQGTLGRQYDEGVLMEAFGFWKIRTDQNIYNHTAGTFVGTPAVNGAVADGATQIVTDGWTDGDTLLQGDVFSVAGTKEVNPLSRRGLSFGTFLVMADAVADVGGNMTIQVSVGGQDAVRGPGQYQNVDVLPADNALITVWPGTTTPSGLTGIQGVAFGKQAFAFAPISFRDPSKYGAWGATARDPKTGISLTMMQQIQVGPYSTAARVDIGYGMSPMYAGNESIRMVGANQ